jgi:DNA-binding MarR family transcriptional regulator
MNGKECAETGEVTEDAPISMVEEVTRPSLASTSHAVRAWVRLLEVQKLTLGHVRDEMEGDISLSRFDLLANLYREDGQTLASLSRHMLVTAGNLTGLVDRAERDNLVKRQADPNDRRATRVMLTEHGREVFEGARLQHQRCLESIFSALNLEEQEQLVEILGKLRKGLKTKPGGESR